MRAALRGLGEWLPDRVRVNADWSEQFVEGSRNSRRRELVDVPELSNPADQLCLQHLNREAPDPFLGTSRRRIAEPTLSAGEAEAMAAHAALEDARLEPEQVDVIMSWSMVPERVSPSSAPDVAHRIGARNSRAFGVDSACSSAVVQLELASALIESGRARTVLLTQSHLVTRAMPMMHPASPNVGDGATALVIGASERCGVRNVFSRTHGEYWDAVTWCRGRDEDPLWFEAGPAMYLGSKSPQGARALVAGTVRFGGDTLTGLLSAARVEPSDVDALATVQPRQWVPGAIAETAGIDPTRAPDRFEELAHLGGCGAIVNLIEARRRGLCGPGGLAAIYAQGAGFTRAAALVEWV